MALDLHDQIYVYFNGKLLVTVTGVDTTLQGDDQTVMTIVKGFAGITPSPKTRILTIDSVVPATSGLEGEMEKAYRDSIEVEFKLQFGGSGKKLITKGYLGPVNVKSAVGQTTTVSTSFTGTPAIFE